MFEKIVELLLNYVEPDGDITEQTNIRTDLGMSSFDFICLGDDIFNEFGVRLTADDFRSCLAVGKLAEFVESKK